MGRLMLGWIWVILVLVVALPAAGCALLGIHSPGLMALVVGVPALLGLLLVYILRTLDTIYRTALYVFATEGVVPEPFDDPELHAVFCASPEQDT